MIKHHKTQEEVTASNQIKIDRKEKELQRLIRKEKILQLQIELLKMGVSY